MGQRLHKITGTNGIMHVFDDHIEIEQNKKAIIQVCDLKSAKLENNVLVLDYSSDCCNFEISPEKNELATRIALTINDLIEKNSQKKQINFHSTPQVSLGIDIDKILDEYYEDETAVPLKVRELTGISLREAERVTGDALRRRGVKTKLGIPLNWHAFICYISLPLSILRTIGELGLSEPPAAAWVQFLFIIQITLTVVLITGLVRFKKYGYYMLYALYGYSFVISLVSCIILLTFGALTPYIAGEFCGAIAVMIPTIIYYRKRKFLFS